MRSERRAWQMRLALCTTLALSLAAIAAERAGLLTAVRSGLHDALSPGRLLLLSVSFPREAPGQSVNGNSAVPTDDVESARMTQMVRQLMIENARLRRDLKREQEQSAVAALMEPTGSLARYDVVESHILSSSGLPGTLKELLIDSGRDAGVMRSQLVVDGDGVVVDAGTERRIAPGDRVLTGAAVVGRVEKVARWVSMVQPVTANGFRAQVTLMRTTADGRHFGASGVLEGTGDHECRLTGVPHTDAVAVGDDVVSADVAGVRGPRLYFGRVTKADFLAGGQWDVRVEPAASIQDLETVGILRLGINSGKAASSPADGAVMENQP